MDEVDIDNVEDLNELEARLYAQIHHEATDVPIDEHTEKTQSSDNQQVQNSTNSSNNNTDIGPNYETSVHTNKVLSRRYWSSGENSLPQRAQHYQQNNKHRLIRNPFKTSDQVNPPEKSDSTPSTLNKSENQTQLSKQMQIETTNDNDTLTTNENFKTKQDNSKINTEIKNTDNVVKTSNARLSVTCTTAAEDVTTTYKENKKNKDVHSKVDQRANQNLETVPAIEKSNLKLNPVADWMKRNKQQLTKKSGNNIKGNGKSLQNNNSISKNLKDGPFGKQQLKLQKAKRLEEKKQKSKKAKNTAKAIANKTKPTEIIDLDTDNESDNSDVILVPVAPPPTFTVEDSGDEDDKSNVPIILEHEENAIDSTDVQMSSTLSTFIKPQQILAQSSEIVEGGDRRYENSSRCTSPCSIQSSDDFIGQNDRSRLLTAASGMADDEDLLVLTSDINSLLEAPQSAKQNSDNENNSDKEVNQEESAVEEPDQDKEASDSLNFAAPIISSVEKPTKDYRVDQTQFRALDVYESESDITDSVYSKGASKPTVIRQIDSSSDEVEDIGSSSQRTKRLRKRRASSSNKESDAGNDISVYSTDDADEADDAADDDNKLLRTPIPFIARGPAVERCKPRKRSRTLSSCSPIAQKRKFAKSTVSPGHMSDTEFIATLNTLVQGQEEDGDQDGEDDESETENTPTARDIAEKILTKHTRDENANKSLNDDIAVPEEILKDLDKVFDAIDKMDKSTEDRSQYSIPDNAVNISDSSDSDIENRIIYKSTPYDHDTQLIAITPNSSKPDNNALLKANKENGFPVYNVIYSRGLRKPGGLGWNDEMRKFYNDSWNGEHFVLSKVLQKMNPDKNLWKIYTEDRFNNKSNRRHNNLKCTNCCEFGHMRSKCKRPRKPKICYMCGESGHNEPRCPNTICLRCGNKTQVFTKSCNSCTYQNRLTCPICKIRGHSLDYCPDKWRRYHSTTEPNVHPNNSINYNPRKYCCICGARGHLSDNCRSAVRFMEYPIIVSTVKSHQKSYGDIPLKVPHNGIGLNLMYEPCQEYNFDLVARTSLDKYYGRFLRAVGLEFLLRRNERQISMNREVADTTAKKDKRFSKKYVANPYSKIGTANQQNIESIQDAPYQVQEITESGNCTDDQNDDEPIAIDEVINVDDNSVDIESVDNDTDMIGSTVNDDMENIQLNTVNERPTAVEESEKGNFKSPKNVPSSIDTSSKSSTEPPVVLDSDSNYSFSEHFDIPSKSVDVDAGADSQVVPSGEVSILLNSSRPRPRAMETLPDFIPLFDSSREEINETDNRRETSLSGISRRFVAAETDDEMECDESRERDGPLPELPCEAKIYLTHVHSKYLLSPMGNAFLIKVSKSHNLKARLDFTSVGHVLVIFGLPSNQDKFQRELLLKYRELVEENNQKQCQNNLNVPKRADVLIRFLRDNITQLLNNLGNVNQLLKRLQFLERQQSKSGNKLAEKVRRSLNMILVGQAGLKDGTMHLDKLLRSLKTLINDYSNDEVTSPQLRSEITDHWKVIFSPYRHENYQQLVDAYNKLISKNRVPKLIIDPLLLGQKVLDTSLTEEQKQKLEQPRLSVTINEITDAEPGKQIVPNPLNEKTAKMTKRKHNACVPNTPSSPSPSEQPSANKVKTPTSRPVSPSKILQNTLSRTDNSGSPINFKAKTTATSNCNPSGPSTPLKAKIPGNTSTPIKTKTPNSATSATNNSKPIGNPTTPKTILSVKKQAQKAMPPPPFANPEKRSAVSTTIQKVSDKWKSSCDTLLMEISSDKPTHDKNANGGRLREAKLPSTFWSRESMRYLDDCVRLASARSDVLEKLKRVQNKSKNGKLSYNDYLAVIKLHTALCGK